MLPFQPLCVDCYSEGSVFHRRSVFTSAGSASCLPALYLPLSCLTLSSSHIGIPAQEWKDCTHEQCTLCQFKRSVIQKLLFWELVYCSGLFKHARVESLQISHHCIKLKFCASGVNHTLAQAVQLKVASPWWGRCGWHPRLNVARWHRYIPQNLLLHDLF